MDTLETKVLSHIAKFKGGRSYLTRSYDHMNVEVLPGITTFNKGAQFMQKSMHDSLKWIKPSSNDGYSAFPYQTQDANFLRTVAGTKMNPMLSIGKGEASDLMIYPSGKWLSYVQKIGRIVGSNKHPVNISIGKISVSGPPEFTKDLEDKKKIIEYMNDPVRMRILLDACTKWVKSGGDFKLFVYLYNELGMMFLYKEARRFQVDSVTFDEEHQVFVSKEREGTDWMEVRHVADKTLPQQLQLEGFFQSAGRIRFAWGFNLMANIVFNVAGSQMRGAYKTENLKFAFNHDPNTLDQKFERFKFARGSDIGRFDTTQGIRSTLEFIKATGIFVDDFLNLTNAMLSGIALLKNDHLGGKGNRFSQRLNSWKPYTEQGGTSGHGMIAEANKGLGGAIIFDYMDAAFASNNKFVREFNKLYGTHFVKGDTRDLFSEDLMRSILAGNDNQIGLLLAGDDATFMTNSSVLDDAYTSSLHLREVVKIKQEEAILFLGSIVCKDKPSDIPKIYPNSFTYLRNGYMPEYDIRSSNREGLWRYGRLQARLHHLKNPCFHHFIEAEDKAYRDYMGSGADLMKDVLLQPDLRQDLLDGKHYNLATLEFMENPAVIHYKRDSGEIDPEIYNLFFLTYEVGQLGHIEKSIINNR